MKALKNKTTGKLTLQVKKKEPIISHWSAPKTEEKAAREFGRNLRESGKDDTAKFKQVSARKYIRED